MGTTHEKSLLLNKVFITDARSVRTEDIIQLFAD